MSYIRSGSNPESLYIFGSVSGNVELSWFDLLGEHWDAECPQRMWDSFFRKIWRLDRGVTDTLITHRDLSVRDVWFHVKTNKIVSTEIYSQMTDKFFKAASLSPKAYKRIRVETECRNLIELRIGGKSLYMWGTTWSYLYDSVLSSLGLIKYKRSPGRGTGIALR